MEIKDDVKEKSNVDVPVYMKYATLTRIMYEHLVQPLKNFYIEKILEHPYEKSYVKQIMMIDKIPSMIMEGYKVSDKEDIKDFMSLSFIDNRYAYYKIKDILKKEFHVDIDILESNEEKKWEDIKKNLNSSETKYIIEDMGKEIEKVYRGVLDKHEVKKIGEVHDIRLLAIYILHENLLEQPEFHHKYPYDDNLKCINNSIEYLPKYLEISEDLQDFIDNLKILFNIKEEI